MIESNLIQPKKIEEYVLENNAMLQIMIHNQAYLMQFMSDIYHELHYSRFKRYPEPQDRLFKIREKQALDKLAGYKEQIAKIYEANLKNAKINY